MQDLIKTALLLALVYTMTHAVGQTAHNLSVQHTRNQEVPVQFDKGGSDKGYIHGDHCMDSRVF